MASSCNWQERARGEVEENREEKNQRGRKTRRKKPAPPSGRRDRRGTVRGLGRVWNNYSDTE